MTLVVGLTGGIGSGKSIAAQFFKELGVTVIDTDAIARELTEKGTKEFKEIVRHFGDAILTPEGEINRTQLREIVFNRISEKKWLESLLHPAIYKIFQQKISLVKDPYCIVLVPLLTEYYHLYHHHFDHIIVIDTTEERQIQWAAKRDNCSPSLIKKVILTQASREQRLKIANFILDNNASLELLKAKVMNLHYQFLRR